MKKTLLLVLALCLSLSLIYADGFKDTEGHWALNYIEEIKESGVIQGYPDGSFKPDNKVTKSESVLMLYRTLNSMGLVEKTEEATLANRYKNLMDKNNIAEWEGLREAIAYFLEHNIIPEEDLTDFMRNNKHVNMTRERLSYYLGKTLNEYLKQDTGGIIESVFKDMSDINPVFLQYIDLLYKNKVISGDNHGNFNPKKSITRAELTKLLVESKKLLKSNETLEEKVVEATIATKLDNSNRIIFYDIKDKTKSYNEIIDNKIKVLLNDAAAGYKDLQIDMQVKLTYSNSKLVKIEASDVVYETVVKSGQVTEVIPDKNFLYFRNSETDKLEFAEIANSVNILVEGEKGNLSKELIGKYAFLSYKKDNLFEIEFKSKNERFEGTIASLDVAGKTSISIKIGDNIKNFEFAKDAIINRDFVKASLADLKVEDNVVIETEYGKIVRLDSSANTTFVTGKVAKISKGDSNILTLQKDDGGTEDFIIPSEVKVIIDGVNAGLFDLKIDYNVRLKYDGSNLISIEVKTKASSQVYTGRIVAVHSDVKIIIIEMLNNRSSISVSDDTLILSPQGNKYKFSDLKEGKNIFVYGLKDGLYIKAEKMMVLE